MSPAQLRECQQYNYSGKVLGTLEKHIHLTQHPPLFIYPSKMKIMLTNICMCALIAVFYVIVKNGK